MPPSSFVRTATVSHLAHRAVQVQLSQHMTLLTSLLDLVRDTPSQISKHRLILCADTGGSVRGPAGGNGIYGIRPSVGAISLDEVVPLSDVLDTGGYVSPII